jgi:hypothetical protein
VHGHIDVDDRVAVVVGPVDVGHYTVVLWQVSLTDTDCSRSSRIYHPRVMWLNGVVDGIRNSQEFRSVTIVSMLSET